MNYIRYPMGDKNMELDSSEGYREEKLISLVKKYSGVKNIKRDDDLEKNIGLTGDDAYEFLVEYGKTFNVDISKFPFDEYFYDEGEFLILLARNILKRKYKKKKFTLENLMAGLDSGYLS